jgi:hypothetical protein
MAEQSILPKTPGLEYFAYFALSHYLNGVMILITVAALIIAIIHYKRHRNLRILTWYIAFSLVQDMAAVYAYPTLQLGNYSVTLFHAITIAFMFFEFIVCNLFILRYIGSSLRRRIIRINALLFLGFVIFAAALTHPDFSDPYYIVPECVFLVIPCLIYFYELFLTMNLRPLKDQPAFWVVTGILFLNACDIPLLLTAKLMGNYFREVYSLNYILYIVLFALLIRAFLCPPNVRPGRHSESCTYANR